MTATTETTDITIVSGPTSSGTASDWELFFARRALATLKARLGRQGLLDLLQPDLAASAKTLTACAASSDGQWRPAVTQLHAEGLSAAEFLAYASPTSAKTRPSGNSCPITPSAWRAPSRSPTAPSSDTPCTNSVTPAPGSTHSWSSTSRPPRRTTSSKDTASTWPWNSPTGSPRPAYHSAGPVTHPSHPS